MSVEVTTLYVMIHPLVYESSAHRPDFLARYREYVEYEKVVKERWYRRMAELGPNEVLVIGSPGCPEGLERYALETLGARAIILKEVLAQEPERWDDALSDEMKAGLGRDLLAMYWKYGFSWKSDELGQPVVTRLWADRIRQRLSERRFAFDPATVRAQGWGESFEGCVSNYTRFLGSYLGLGHPIENEFEMTVPDFRVLMHADYFGRIPLGENVRLYLWQGEDGRQIAWFHRALAYIGDPPVYVRFPLGEMMLEVRTYARLIWPIADSFVEWQDGLLTVPIWGAQNDVPISGTHFIFARGIERDAFRDVMKNAEIIVGKVEGKRYP